MKTINIKVRNKIAVAEHIDYVCDNSDYQLVFDFDEEWDSIPTKTARFKFGASYIDVLMDGNICNIPILEDIDALFVGVFGGNLSTTTSAFIHCRKSIRSGDGAPVDPTPDVYDQIMEKLNEVEGEIPTKTSELINDSGFIGESELQPIWDELGGKQNQLQSYTEYSDRVEIENEEIRLKNPNDNNVISASVGGITLSHLGKNPNFIEVNDNGVFANNYKVATSLELRNKQDRLIAGENVTINDNVISVNVPPSYESIEEYDGRTSIENDEVWIETKNEALIEASDDIFAMRPNVSGIDVMPNEVVMYSRDDEDNYTDIELNPRGVFINGSEVATKDIVDDENIKLDTTWSSQKIADKINDIELAKFPNVTIVGTPTIQQGQISNFNATNYCQFPFVVDFKNQPFTLDFEFTTGNEVANQHNIFDSLFGLAFAVRNSKFVIAISTNGTSWNIGESIGTHTITTNTTYRVRMNWDLANFTLSYSTDGGETYTTDITRALTEQPFPKQMFIGITSDKSTFFNGIINLNYATLTIANKVVWQGMDDVGLSTRMAVNMSNIDEEGINKVKSIVKEVGSDSPIHITYGERVNLVPETTLNFTKDGDNAWYVSQENPFGALTRTDLFKRAIYKINFDGVEYTELSALTTFQNSARGSRYLYSVGNTNPLGVDSRYLSTANFAIVYNHNVQDVIKVICYDDLEADLNNHKITIDIIPFNYVSDLGITYNNKNYSANIMPSIYAGNGSDSIVLAGGQKANQQAIACGSGGIANGIASFAGGLSCISEGQDSFAYGQATSAVGKHTIAFGSFTEAIGNISSALGQHTTTNGAISMAIGNYTNSNARASFAGGNVTTAGYNAQFVVGYGNDNKADSVFEVGNGLKSNGTPNSDGNAVAATPQNALRVTQTGEVLAQTALGIEKADGTKLEITANDNALQINGYDIATKADVSDEHINELIDLKLNAIPMAESEAY